MRAKVTALGGLWRDSVPTGARDWKERVKGANRQWEEIRREEQGFRGWIENSEWRDGGKLSSGRGDKEGVRRWYRDEETDWDEKGRRASLQPVSYRRKWKDENICLSSSSPSPPLVFLFPLSATFFFLPTHSAVAPPPSVPFSISMMKKRRWGRRSRGVSSPPMRPSPE